MHPRRKRWRGMADILGEEYYMNEALKEAQLAYERGEIPVGAIIVCNRRIVAKGHNQTEQLQDATAHAEMLALTAAMNYLGSKYLPECTLYVTLEPCPMCAAALHWAQLKKIVFGASDEKRGFQLFRPSLVHPKTEIKRGVLEEESRSLLQQFFRERRQ